MATRSIISLLVALLGLVGCTLAPHYQRPSATVPARFPGPDPGDGVVAGAALATDVAWHQVFVDQRLKTLIALALTNNLDLRVAILNVEQARAQYRLTRSASLPIVEGSGGFSRSHAKGITANSWSANIGATAYEVDFFGRVHSLNQQALEKFLATVEGQRTARLSLVAEVASEYFTWRAAQDQQALTQRTLETVRESYAINRATFEAGAATELDLRTAEAQVESANVDLLASRRQITQAENYLTLLLGRPLPADLPPAASFEAPDLVMEVRVGLTSELVERRPDILQAEHNLLAAHANIGAARAAFFPSIKLTGSVGTTSAQLDQLFGAGTGVWTFAPQITLPIFTGGRNRADLAAAEVGAQIEVVNYQKAIQSAFREVADALVTNQSYGEQLAAQQRLIAAQQRRFDLATAQYHQGDTTYLEVLNAQQELYKAQQGRLESRLNQLLGRISLYRALGGGWK